LASAVGLHAEFWETDDSFAPVLEGVGNGDSPLTSVYASPGGKVLVVTGYSVNGIAAPIRPIRLNPDGSTDLTFHVAADSWLVLAVYADGRVLVRRSINESPYYTEIGRLLADGTVDPTFVQLKLGSEPRAALFNDERILLYGSFVNIGGKSQACVAVLNSNGTLSAGFSSPVPADNRAAPTVNSAYPLADGRILMTSSGTGVAPLARLNTDGSVDSSFSISGVTFSSSPMLLGVTTGGSILVTTGSGNLARLTASGVLDTAFIPQFVASSTSGMSLQPDGKIYYLAYAATNQTELRRLNLDGSRDASFLISTPYAASYEVKLPIVGDDGALLFSSALSLARQLSRIVISRVHSDGTVDSNFNPRIGKRATIAAFLRLPDGKTLLSGDFAYINGVPFNAPITLVRLNSDGSLDPAFSVPLFNESIGTLTRQPSGKIIALGSFGSGSSLRSLVRFNTDGTRDTGFTFAPANSMPVGLDSEGNFYVMTADSPPKLVRYTSEGVPDPTFQSGFTGTFTGFMPLADGGLLLLPSLARLRHDGSVDSGFSVPKNSIIGTFIGAAPLPDGRAVMFSEVNAGGGSYLRAIRVSTTGAIDYTYAGRFIYGGQSIDYPAVGEITLDLLDAASAPAGVVLPVEISAFGTSISTAVDSAGKFFVRKKSTDSTFSVYRGKTLTRPAADPSPTIIYQQLTQSTSAPAGAAFFFNVTAGGLFPLTYQWSKDGKPIPGATTSVYRLTSARTDDTGVYILTVTNSYGTASTTPVRFSVDASAFAGTYFGQSAGVTGDVALILHPNCSGAMLLNFPGSGTAVVAENFAVLADGTYSAVGRLLPRGSNSETKSVTVTGTFTTGVVTGAIGALNLTFRATKATDLGYGLAGFYSARALDSPDGALYAIVGTDIRIYVLANSSSTVTGTYGVWGSGGNFQSTPSLPVAIVFDATTGMLSGSGAAGTFAGMRFAGLRDDVLRTDRLANISTRGRAGTGEDVLIAGFVVSGTAPRPVLVRAIGPALTPLGVTGALADSQLALFSGSTKIAESDNWGVEPHSIEIAAASSQVGAFALPLSGKDAALLVTLAPGSYTAQVSGQNNTSGVALVEVYDAGSPGPASTTPKLINIATRGRVGTGDDVLIAGIVVTGNVPKRVLIRGIGPTLGTFGVAGTLADPVLTLYNGSTSIATNDDWGLSTQVTDIGAAAASVGAFPLLMSSKDACLLITLQPGISYTAQISGKSGATGIALVEVYEVPN
jgi:uncharacterized delta-60 repeat protein